MVYFFAPSVAILVAALIALSIALSAAVWLVSVFIPCGIMMSLCWCGRLSPIYECRPSLYTSGVTSGGLGVGPWCGASLYTSGVMAAFYTSSVIGSRTVGGA